MKIPVYNSNGEQTKEIELSARLFGVTPKTEVIHQVVVAQLANKREVIADTKDKGEVRGGGKKPWKQKGTGRARHGSIRSPLWRGGGVTFGPTTDRNFSKAVNKKQKQLAMAMCLSDRVSDNSLVVFEKLEAQKTKEAILWIKDIKKKIEALKDGKRFLLVLDENDQKTIRSINNLEKVNTILADSLNCVEILKADKVLVSMKAIEKIEKHYKQLKEKKEKVK
ncbi:MAG: 50S ribosomal protein L4 [bacterium]